MVLKVYRETTELKDTFVCISLEEQKRYEITVAQVDKGFYNVIVVVNSTSFKAQPKVDEVFLKTGAKQYYRVNKSLTGLLSVDIEAIIGYCPKELLDSAFGFWLSWIKATKPRVKLEKYEGLVDWDSLEARRGKLDVELLLQRVKKKKK